MTVHDTIKLSTLATATTCITNVYTNNVISMIHKRCSTELSEVSCGRHQPLALRLLGLLTCEWLLIRFIGLATTVVM